MEKDDVQMKHTELSSKHDLIANACLVGNVDELVKLANSEGGLLNDQLRVTACKCSFPAAKCSCLTNFIGPLLLGCTKQNESSLDGSFWQDLPAHCDEEQVQKDVDRAFVYYPTSESESWSQTSSDVKQMRVKSQCNTRKRYCST